jgi:protein-S-isoprenylcysteine O-methyltransferase Ste14
VKQRYHLAHLIRMRVLALIATLPAAATFHFWVLWRWFEVWRRHRVLVYTVMFASFAVVGTAAWAARDSLLDPALDVPLAVAIVGWGIIAAATIFGTVADRQIGFRVRSFTPFFEPNRRMRLVTTGAYAVVRHPIYASGIGFQLGVLLVTAAPAVGASLVIFALGARWFTRQEEERLMELLDDPGEYARYRARVPALLPLRRSGAGSPAPSRRRRRRRAS